MPRLFAYHYHPISFPKDLHENNDYILVGTGVRQFPFKLFQLESNKKRDLVTKQIGRALHIPLGVRYLGDEFINIELLNEIRGTNTHFTCNHEETKTLTNLFKSTKLQSLSWVERPFFGKPEIQADDSRHKSLKKSL